MTSTRNLVRGDSFLDNFLPLFDIYWTVPQPQLDECWFLSAEEWKVYVHIQGLSRCRTKKFNGLESHVLGG